MVNWPVASLPRYKVRIIDFNRAGSLFYFNDLSSGSRENYAKNGKFETLNNRISVYRISIPGIEREARYACTRYVRCETSITSPVVSR